MADFVLVAAKTGDEDQRGRINLFIVEKGTKGFDVGRKEDKIGARGVPSHALFFDGAYVPEANRLGDEATGFRVAMAALNDSRPIIGARGVGLAQVAIDHAIEFIKNRSAFGRTIAEFQGVRWMIAIAKCHATDTAMKVATDAVQLFGAAGVSNEYPINRYFRDAKVLQIIEGTNQIQRNIISRNLLD
jgi:alkylation response protein AidB-like acyl-CoA dehydrogenase